MNPKISQMVEKLKKISFCEGIVYAGSRTDGNFTKTSDYDFTILVGKGKSFFETFIFNGVFVDVACSTLEILKKHDLVRNKLRNPELHILAYGEILYDKFGKMETLQKKAKRLWELGPIKYTQKDFREAGYLCVNSLHKLSKTLSTTSYHTWTEIMDKITRLFFELNAEWLPKASLREDRIKQIDRIFFKLYIKVYRADEKARINATKQLIQYLIKKFHLPQTGVSYASRDEN
jgi:hypothetical protein